MKYTSNFSKISKDIVFNIIANLIPAAVLQLVVLPYIARELGDESNGKFLTILALLHFIVPITSNSLSTAKLLLNQKYQEEKKCGDFNLWLSIFGISNTALVVIGCLFYFDGLYSFDIFTICLLSLIWMIKDYLLVEFRLSLTYSKILINNLFLSIGFFIGILIFNYFPQWYVIFICGYSFAIIHAILATTLLQEPIRITDNFNLLSKVIIKLAGANILGLLAVNMDRLLLFPIAGGAVVSIYFSASIIGKMMTLISSPISNVFLSYFVRIKHISLSNLHRLLIITVGLGLIAYFVILLISPFLLEWLYPLWYHESMQYIPLTSGISALELVITLTNPILLRFCGVNTQMKLQTVYFLLYLLCGLLFYQFWGLIGFATGILLATFIKMILTCYHLIKSISTINKKISS
mgnify:FL=1